MTSDIEYIWSMKEWAGWYDGQIHVNIRYTQQRDQVLLHEAGHAAGLGHCDTWCLMHPVTSYFFDKDLCKDCNEEIYNNFNSDG